MGRGALDQVGWVQQVLVNRRSGLVVDDHARVALALSRNEPSVPVLYVDLEPDEEALVLATLDPIGAMAGRDDEKLRALLAEATVAPTSSRCRTCERRPRTPVGTRSRMPCSKGSTSWGRPTTRSR